MLEIKNLNIEFHRSGDPGEAFSAVDGLNLRVSAGSFTALVGESGSGKSVTALSVCRLIKPSRTSGSILFASRDKETKDLLLCPESELLKVRGAEIGYIFQDPGSSLNPLMKIGEQLHETCTAHLGLTGSEAEKRSLAFLASVKIQDVSRVFGGYPHELSGGMKQRVMIAMALIAEPRLLIADEPTTALDGLTEYEVMGLLAGLKKERSLTIFFITHNLPLATQYADVIHVMRKGRLVETMTPGPKGFSPTEAYTRRLFNAGLYNGEPKSILELS
jgi:ABC-type dipeptide/oligopeptide/nickel transport system ATPase component